MLPTSAPSPGMDGRHSYERASSKSKSSSSSSSTLLPLYSSSPSSSKQRRHQSLSQYNRVLLVCIMLISMLMIVMWFYTHSSIGSFRRGSKLTAPDTTPDAEIERLRRQIERELVLLRQRQQQQQQSTTGAPPPPLAPGDNLGDVIARQQQHAVHGGNVGDVDDDPVNQQRRQSVVDAMRHAWDGYVRHAWGRDELRPHARTGKDWVRGGGMAMTIVDALDTLWIMGLRQEFQKGADYVVNTLRRFNTINTSTSVFETIIRMVGGLITAYELSGQSGLLERAREMADTLMPAFTGDIPKAQLNFATGVASNPGWTRGSAVLAEFMTIQLEYRRLSQLTGDDRYDRVATRVMDVMQEEQRKRSDGLWPLYYNEARKEFTTTHISLGAMGDSAYEYLLKQWLMSGKREKRYLDMYIRSVKGMEEKLLARSTPSNLLYLADFKDGAQHHKMDHLACFAGGMFALAAHEGACESQEQCDKQLEWGKELTKTCYEAYRRQATGIGPETMNFPPGKDVTPGVRSYILRPETIESIFILYRVTGDPMYREWGWEMFEAIEKHCKVPGGGYSGLRDVTRANSDGARSNHDDVMQTFFLVCGTNPLIWNAPLTLDEH